jgi:hypothetical protein
VKDIMLTIHDDASLAGIGDDITNALQKLGGAAWDRALAEVEARAKKGAEEAVKTPLLIAYGVGGLSLLLAIIALVKG